MAKIVIDFNNLNEKQKKFLLSGDNVVKKIKENAEKNGLSAKEIQEFEEDFL